MADNKPEKITSTVSTILQIGGRNIHIQNKLESKKLTATQDPKSVAMDLQGQNLQIMVDVIEAAVSGPPKEE